MIPDQVPGQRRQYDQQEPEAGESGQVGGGAAAGYEAAQVAQRAREAVPVVSWRYQAWDAT